jgi:hypothetical protein
MCHLADAPDWVKRQRKVSREAASGGCFTLAMLKQDCRIPKGMRGLDPGRTDKERAADEAAWFTAHPVITAEEIEDLRRDAREGHEFYQRAFADIKPFKSLKNK